MTNDDHRPENQPDPTQERPLYLGKEELDAAAGPAKFIAVLVSALGVVFAILGIYLVGISEDEGKNVFNFAGFELTTNSVGLTSIGIGAIVAIVGIASVIRLLIVATKTKP